MDRKKFTPLLLVNKVSLTVENKKFCHIALICELKYGYCYKNCITYLSLLISKETAVNNL